MLVYSRNRKSLRLNQRGEKVDFWKFDVMILVFLMMIILRLLCNEMVWETNSLLGYRSRRKGGGGQRRFNYLSHFTFCVINLQHNFGTSVQDSYTPNVTQIDFCRKVLTLRDEALAKRVKPQEQKNQEDEVFKSNIYVDSLAKSFWNKSSKLGS